MGAGTANIPRLRAAWPTSSRSPAPASLALRPKDPGACACSGRWGKVPLKPFNRDDWCGTPQETRPAQHSPSAPRRREHGYPRTLRWATEFVFLPVEVAGALFSVGDTHAAQGDGEVLRHTAIERPMRRCPAIRFAENKRRSPIRAFRNRRAGYPAISTREGTRVTTGIGPDLMEACTRVP